MQGILFALLGGAFITLQNLANAKLGSEIGAWQTLALGQLTGLVLTVAALLVARRGGWRALADVPPLYLAGGALAAPIVFGAISAIQAVGATLAIGLMLVAQIGGTFLLEQRGWFGLERRALSGPRVLGIGLLIAGVAILGA